MIPKADALEPDRVAIKSSFSYSSACNVRLMRRPRLSAGSSLHTAAVDSQSSVSPDLPSTVASGFPSVSAPASEPSQQLHTAQPTHATDARLHKSFMGASSQCLKLPRLGAAAQGANVTTASCNSRSRVRAPNQRSKHLPRLRQIRSQSRRNSINAEVRNFQLWHDLASTSTQVHNTLPQQQSKYTSSSINIKLDHVHGRPQKYFQRCPKSTNA